MPGKDLAYELWGKEVASITLYLPSQLSICFVDGTVLTVESKDGSDLEVDTSVVAY